MDGNLIENAKKEIKDTLKLCIFSMRPIGLSFEKPKTTAAYIRQKIVFSAAIFGMCAHVFTEFMFIVFTFANSPRVENVVPLLHIFCYGVLCFAKVFVLWYKNIVFGELINELTGIWPVPPLEGNATEIKEKSLKALRIFHKWYFTMNVTAVWFFNLTPIIVYFYRNWHGQDAEIGYVWSTWYPFDKTQPIAHVVVYLIEIYGGTTCVWIMVSSDLLFVSMASHIALLLRLLQQRLETIGLANKSDEEHYEDIRSNIKLHQRLISYCNNLEEAFSLCNLINIVMSSINLCCVVFVIVLLEPLISFGNKLFLGSALIQIGAMCWYADDIFHANENISAAAYNSKWYELNPKCRRALLFLILRCQKPIAFTAMKFTNISLVTYSAILTRSYSYFALLYTMYSEN